MLKIFLAVLVAASPLAHADEKPPKKTVSETAKEVGHAVGTASREVGHGTKTATKEVGKAVSSAARETGHAFRDGTREVKKAVKGQGDASSKGESTPPKK